MTSETEFDAGAAIHIPIVEERLRVGKQVVETGRVVVTSTVTSEPAAVRESLASTTVRVERVPLDRFVDEAPRVRTEGNRTIVPVFEEVLVKRIRLVEEIHLITETLNGTFDDTIALRRMDVAVDRRDLRDTTV